MCNDFVCMKNDIDDLVIECILKVEKLPSPARCKEIDLKRESTFPGSPLHKTSADCGGTVVWCLFLSVYVFF